MALLKMTLTVMALVIAAALFFVLIVGATREFTYWATGR
jgi:hypothetical protein